MKQYLKTAFSILRKLGFVLYVAIVLTLVVRAYLLRPRVTLDLMIAAEQLSLPTYISHFPDDINRMAVLEKTGMIKWFFTNSSQAEGILLDIEHNVLSATWEEGLLGMAFDCDFKNNRYYYVFYSMEKPMRSRISRFTMNEDYTTDPDTEFVILELKKETDSHNGGMLEFGDDGYLYAAIGYGSWPREDWEMLQDRTSLFGAIIRIDVSESTEEHPYSIPPDNPFVGRDDGSRGEIWAYGFRNQWRFSFDMKTGKMYTGDVGEVSREEIDLVKKGGNYGWPKMEGELCFPITEADDCDKSGFEMPILSMDRFFSRSVTGGYVYRGDKIPWLKGKYVFADFLRGLSYIEVDQPDVMQTVPNILLYKPPTLHGPNKGNTVLISSLGQDENGELYIVNLEGGVYRLSDITFVQQLKGFFYQLTNFK